MISGAILIVIIWIAYSIIYPKQKSNTHNDVQNIEPTQQNVFSNEIYLKEVEKVPDYSFPDGLINLPLNSNAEITYRDANGEMSQRRIRVNFVNGSFSNDYYIEAYCFLREAERTFKLSRISTIIDEKTGKTYEEPYKYFIEQFHNSPIGRVKKYFLSMENEICVLLFLSRSDGYLRRNEREIIISFMAKKEPISLNQDLIENELIGTFCDNKSFKNALKELSQKSSLDKSLIILTSTQIVGVDKKRHSKKEATLKRIKDSLM